MFVELIFIEADLVFSWEITSFKSRCSGKCVILDLSEDIYKFHLIRENKNVWKIIIYNYTFIYFFIYIYLNMVILHDLMRVKTWIAFSVLDFVLFPQIFPTSKSWKEINCLLCFHQASVLKKTLCLVLTC